MYEGDAQPVLRCGQCNKPFDKQSTLKRHGYYCRSRREGATTRSRSCISCARRKARCDNKRPACSRCITKAVECHYPTITHKGPGSKNSDDVLTEQRIIPQEASNEGDVILDITPGISGEYLDWISPDFDFTDLLNSQTNDDATVQYLPSSGLSSLSRHSTPWTEPTFHARHALSIANVSIPPLPTSRVRSLVQRPKATTGAQTIANLMLHTLKSYPRMMLQPNALPPFVNPRLMSSEVEKDYMWPLNNCISLIHMISSGVQGSRKLFWKNVRLECERICAEHLTLNRWELLAALQAQCIYIIIRLDEGETDHNNCDFQLVTRIAAICKRLNSSDQCFETGWKDWIFEESTRRLSVVCQVINMLVYFEPAALCDVHKGIILAPLPTKKQLWEAGDEVAWKAEIQREPGLQTVYGLAAKGELVKLDQPEQQRLGGSGSDGMLLHRTLPPPMGPAWSTANWEEWCSGMDGLGGLVMLAASLTA